MPEVWRGKASIDVGRAAADEIAAILSAHKHPVLALPTGATPRAMYASLVERLQQGEADLVHARIFNLDEYLDLPAGDPRTFRAYMDEVLWSRIPHRPALWEIPDSNPTDPRAACREYDRALARAGTIDLAVVGIGANGHLAFNEPGTPWTSTTHVARLSPETRRAAAAAFVGRVQTPRRAITMGLATLFASRRILLLATGRSKAAILARALTGPPNQAVPASILQTHPNVQVLADAAAAAEL